MLQNKFNGQNNISEADYNKILNEIKKNIIDTKENLKKLMNGKFDKIYKKVSLLEETMKTALKNQEEINKQQAKINENLQNQINQIKEILKKQTQGMSEEDKKKIQQALENNMIKENKQKVDEKR